MEQTLSKSEILRYTELWCREKGLRLTDLTTHPQIDDVMLLVQWRDEVWNHLTLPERSTWGGIWSWTYTRCLPLKNKHLDKLEEIIKNVQARKSSLQAKRNLIKQLRQS